MAQVTVEEAIAVAPRLLWGVVADFGNVGWIPGGDTVRTEGAGPGMVRIFGSGDAEIRERLESVDQHTRSIVYTVPQGLPLPVRQYRATMTVRAGGDGGSVLEWACTFEPQGASEADATAQVAGLYRLMLGWIRDYVTNKSG